MHPNRWFLFITFMVLLLACIPRAVRAEESYDALMSALDELAEAGAAVDAKRTAIAAARANGASTSDIQSLEAELAELNTTLAEKNRVATAAQEQFKQATANRTRLRDHAIRYGRLIAALPDSNPNKSRAMRALYRGLQNLNQAAPQTIEALSILREGLRLGRPVDAIKEEIKRHLDSGFDQSAADIVLDGFDTLLKQALEGRSNLQALEWLDGKLENTIHLLDAVDILRGETEQPFGSPEFERIIKIVDLGSDLLPQELLPYAAYVRIQKCMVQQMYESYLRAIENFQFANIERIAQIAEADSRHAGDHWDLVRPKGGESYFSEIDPEPRLSMAEPEVNPNERFRVSWEGSFKWGNDGWVALYFANYGEPHSRYERLLDYQSIGRINSMMEPLGSVEFTAPDMPGEYELALYPFTNWNYHIVGNTVAPVATLRFKVRGSFARVIISAVELDEQNRPKFQPFEPVQAKILISTKLDNPLLVLIATDYYHGNEGYNERNALKKEVISTEFIDKYEDFWLFEAPGQEGRYDVRLFDHDTPADETPVGRELAYATFVVKPKYPRDDNAWKTYLGHSYRMTPEPMFWWEAERYGREMGGHLVAINFAEEQTWLNENFERRRMWIGFTDENAESKWQWTTGEAGTYTNWAGGEPNNMHNNGENWCVMHWSSNGSWNDLGRTSPEWSPMFGIVEVPRVINPKDR